MDMSKLSPSEKDAMMQQVFSNATTVSVHGAQELTHEVEGSQSFRSGPPQRCRINHL